MSDRRAGGLGKEEKIGGGALLANPCQWPHVRARRRFAATRPPLIWIPHPQQQQLKQQGTRPPPQRWQQPHEQQQQHQEEERQQERQEEIIPSSSSNNGGRALWSRRPRQVR
jgi:hypothetical protein